MPSTRELLARRGEPLHDGLGRPAHEDHAPAAAEAIAAVAGVGDVVAGIASIGEAQKRRDMAIELVARGLDRDDLRYVCLAEPPSPRSAFG